MAVAAARVTVGTSPTPIASVPSTDTVHNSRAGRFLLKNKTHSASVFLGGDDVTTANGWEWETTDPPISWDLEPGETLYGVVASGTQVVHAAHSGRP